MPRLSRQQVVQLARVAGFPDPQLTANVSYKEAGFITDRLGDTTIQTAEWGPSVGLMQIRSLKAQTGTGGIRDREALTDPEFNMRAAKQIWDDADGRWGPNPWAVCDDASCSNLNPMVAGELGVDLVSEWRDLTTGDAVRNIPVVGDVLSFADFVRFATDEDNVKRAIYAALGVTLVVVGIVAIVGPELLRTRTRIAQVATEAGG